MTLIIDKSPSQPKPWQRIEHQKWCNKNGIRIYLEPIDYRTGHIVIDDNGKLEISEEVYVQRIKKKGKRVAWKNKDVKYWDVIPKLYTKIYKEKHE